MQSSPDLSAFGWTVESAADGGVRIQRSRDWRRGAIGCGIGTMLAMIPFAAFGGFIASRFLDGPKNDWFGLLFSLAGLAVLGLVGLMVVVTVLQLLILLLLREHWEVGRNRLLVRRRVLGLTRTQEYSSAELLIDPEYSAGKREAAWRVLIRSGNQQHFLFREPIISASIGSPPPTGTQTQEEAQAIAHAIAEHTGWSVIEALKPGTQAPPPAEHGELPALLQKQGFRRELDGRLRQVLRPPKRGQYGCALISILFGGWAFYIAVTAIRSFVDFARANEQPVWDWTFWIFCAPLLLIGGLLCLLSLIILLGRVQWTLDRNLLIITSQSPGRTKERQYVDCRLALARVSVCSQSKQGSSVSWHWQLQLRDSGGQILHILHRHADDDGPRLLGALLAHATGWPLSESA
jgi:hypothetical protein